MSASLKQKAPALTPTPFASPQRATLAAAIAAAADAGARREALVQAVSTADVEVRAAPRPWGPLVRRRLASAKSVQPQSRLRTTWRRPGLRGMPSRPSWMGATMGSRRCRCKMRRSPFSEPRWRGVGWPWLPGCRVAARTRSGGSGLEWLSRAGAFREPGGRHGEAADENIRHTVLRMESAPSHGQ